MIKNKDFDWDAWFNFHIKAVQAEAVADYRQQLLKAVEEMEDEWDETFGSKLDKVKELLKAKDNMEGL